VLYGQLLEQRGPCREVRRARRVRVSGAPLGHAQQIERKPALHRRCCRRGSETRRQVLQNSERLGVATELHEDLGSKQPIRIICGYRSSETNAMLKRIGRHVATQSQHITGKAIDMYFPDRKEMRNGRARNITERGADYTSAIGFEHGCAFCGRGRQVPEPV